MNLDYPVFTFEVKIVKELKETALGSGYRSYAI